MKPDIAGGLKYDVCDGEASRFIRSSMGGTSRCEHGRPRLQIHLVKHVTLPRDKPGNIKIWHREGGHNTLTCQRINLGGVEADAIEKVEKKRRGWLTEDDGLRFQSRGHVASSSCGRDDGRSNSATTASRRAELL